MQVRYGVDGAWVGANKGNSYFAVTVDPGVHHLCVSWQSALRQIEEEHVRMAIFTAEAGKVYYFAAQSGLTEEVHEASYGANVRRPAADRYKVTDLEPIFVI